MRIAVTGGRNFNDEFYVHQVLKLYADHVDFMILGGARGVDTYAENFAISYGIPHKVIEARWAEFGSAAGPIRNGEMLDELPDIVLAFPGDVGTENMKKQARQRGIAVIECDPANNLLNV